MNVESNVSLRKFSSSIFYGTFLSRVFGLAREVCLAFFFGSSSDIAAFMVAFRFAYLFRRLLGESLLQNSLLPYFESLKSESLARAKNFYKNIFFSLLLTSLAFVVFFESFLIWGLTVFNQKIIFLTMVMMPGLVFNSLFALNVSLLHFQRRFFIPSFAPVIFNIIWISGIILVRSFHAIYALSFVVLVAFVMQWLFTFPFSFSFWKGGKLTKSFSDLKKIAAPLTLVAFGIAATQLNNALDSLFARFSDPCGPAYLWYSIRLQQVPVALFGIAIVNPLLPLLTRAIEDKRRYEGFLKDAIRRALSIMLSSFFAIFILGEAALTLIYGRGNFSQFALEKTLYCLWGYSLSVLPIVLVFILASHYYAKKDYKVPMKGCIYSVLINIALNSFFVFFLKKGPFSITIATFIASLFNLFYLTKKCSFKVIDRSLLSPVLKALFCSCIACSIVFLLAYLLKEPTAFFLLNFKFEGFEVQFLKQLNNFVALSSSFAVVFIFLAWLLKADEVFSLFRKKY